MIVELVFSDVPITHTASGQVMWGCGAVKGAGSPVVADTSLVATLNATTMNELNEYAENNGDSSTWSRWVTLHLNGGTINDNTNQDTPVVILRHFPVPVN